MSGNRNQQPPAAPAPVEPPAPVTETPTPDAPVQDPATNQQDQSSEQQPPAPVEPPAPVATGKKVKVVEPPKPAGHVERAKAGEVYVNDTHGMVSIKGAMFPPGEERALTDEELDNDQITARIPQAVKNGLLRKVK